MLARLHRLRFRSPQRGSSSLVKNHFHGPVGNVAQNSSSFTQSATLNFDQLRELANTIRTQLATARLKEPEKATVEAQLTTIDAQLASPAPNEGIIREAGRSLRTIIEGAIAGAIVQPEVWH